MEKDIYGLLYKEKIIQSMGGYGGVVINDTTAHDLSTKPVVMIRAITNTVFTTLTCDGIFTNSLTVAAVGADYGTLVAGDVLYGEFTAITLTSGSVVAYFKE